MLKLLLKYKTYKYKIKKKFLKKKKTNSHKLLFKSKYKK